MEEEKEHMTGSLNGRMKIYSKFNQQSNFPVFPLPSPSDLQMWTNLSGTLFIPVITSLCVHAN